MLSACRMPTSKCNPKSGNGTEWNRFAGAAHSISKDADFER